jgi:uncharacterized protein YjbI with pentapeptide repeats
MNVLKPQPLGVLTRTLEHDRKCWLVVAAFVPFTFDGHLGTEAELWTVASDAIGSTPLDLCMPKVGAELLVGGKAFAPARAPVRGLDVRVSFGSIDKRLRVIGDRVWNGARPSDPVPFSEMPLDISRAFGGEGFPENPSGRGFVGRLDSSEGRPLPNVEDPRSLITSPSQRPSPATFAPLDFNTPNRLARAGTYDGAWLKTQFPGLARNVDWSIFNRAPADQHLAAIRGDESFVCENMHAQRSSLEGRLPAVVARVFLQLVGAERLAESPARLDTVWLFPHAERGALVFRTLAQIREDDAADVARIVVAAEDVGVARPLAHYENVLRERTDRVRAQAAALRDDDLLPSKTRPAIAKGEPDDPLHINMKNRTTLELEKARALLAKHGLDSSKLLAPAADVDEAANTNAAVANAEKTAQTKQREAHRAIEAAYAKAGLDAKATNPRSSGEPPRVGADGETAKLSEMAKKARDAGHPNEKLEELLSSGALEERLASARNRALHAYALSAHSLDPARARSREESESLRGAVLAACSARRSLARQDFTGADLSGLDLSGADFEEALLDGANLSRCKFTGANLRGAVCAHANLRHADLSKAKAQRANLGGAKLMDVVARDADFSEAILAGAKLGRGDFQRARLTRANLADVEVTDAQFDDAILDGVAVAKASLRGARFQRASLIGAQLTEVDARGVDFSRADLRAATFINVTAEGVDLRGAILEGGRLTGRTSLASAQLEDARASNTNFRGVDLHESNFSRADIRASDFSGADLRRAKLYRALACDARFVQANLEDATMVAANLMQAWLGKAVLNGTDFRGANLFRADLARTRVDTRTNWKDALLDEARVLPGAAP